MGTLHNLDIARVWDSISTQEDCWEWTGSLRPDGYGRIYFGGRDSGRVWRAHRLVYEVLVGPIPDGMTLDHLCRNRRCVNPDHLEPVPNRENVLRGIGITAENKRKTHCVRGHEFTPDNTYAHGSKRHCRTCRTENMRERRRNGIA